MSKVRILYLQMFSILVLPELLIALPLGTFNQRGEMISVGVFLLVLVFTYITKPSLYDLGIRKDTLKTGVVPYSIFTVIGVTCLIILGAYLHKQPMHNWWMRSHLQWGFLPISFLQEYIYRAFFQTRLQKMIKPVYAIATTALAFSFLHILWGDPIILILSLVGGIAWGYLWYKYPNLLLITLSHAVINFSIIYLGFFPWVVTDFFNLK